MKKIQKVSFVHTFIEKFDRFIYTAVLPQKYVEFLFNFFDKNVNKMGLLENC